MAWRRGRSRAASGAGGGGRAALCALCLTCAAFLSAAAPAAATRGYITSDTTLGYIETDTFQTGSIGNVSEAMVSLGRAPGGTLQGIDLGDARDQALHTISAVTGASTTAGPLLDDGDDDRIFAALSAVRGDGLFATAEIVAPASANQLYRVDLATGAATERGPSASDGVLVALAGDCQGRLLGVDDTNQLVRVDRADGSWTAIGGLTPLPLGAIPRALAYDHADERLFLLTDEPKIYEVEPSTGALTPTTFVPSGTFANVSTLAIDGPDACHTNRSLSLTYNDRRERFTGRLRAAWAPCAAGEKVVVFRRRPGRDQRVGEARTNRKGRFALAEDGRGSYYAKAPRSAGADGTCEPVRSQTKRAPQ